MPRGKVPMNLPIIWRKTSRKHPGLIIGSRFRNDENQKRHFDTNGDLLGDYEQGWERKLPKITNLLTGTTGIV